MVNWSVISGKYSLIKDKCNKNFTFISTIITTDNTDAECKILITFIFYETILTTDNTDALHSCKP